MYWPRVLRGRVALRTSDRSPHESFTRFFRNPTQLAALTGPTLDFLDPASLGRPLRIVVLACSNGAEPYTFASTIVNERSDIEFEMIAGDIKEELVEKCQQGIYTREEVYNHETLCDDFVSRTFDSEDGQSYQVRSNIMKHVEFLPLDALDANLVEKTGKADILLLQNVLFNVEPEMAQKMFVNMLSLLNEKAVVFLDGVDLHQRAKLTKRHGLQPLNYQVEKIHEEVRQIRKEGWPQLYWGIEPYWPHRKDALRRYATIYLHETRT